jgi:hypothetical protein
MKGPSQTNVREGQSWSDVMELISIVFLIGQSKRSQLIISDSWLPNANGGDANSRKFAI